MVVDTRFPGHLLPEKQRHLPDAEQCLAPRAVGDLWGWISALRAVCESREEGEQHVLSRLTLC